MWQRAYLVGLIPNNNETNDNIAAFWAPEKLLDVDQQLEVVYRLHFSCDANKIHSPDFAYVKHILCSAWGMKQANLTRQPDGTSAFQVNQVNFVGQPLREMNPALPAASQISVGDNTNMVENNVRFNPATQEGPASDPAS